MHLLPAQSYLAFVAVSLAVVVAPGPDTIGVLTLGVSRGRSAGIGYALGCALGCLTHTTWAAIGVAALIAASTAAFTALKLVGAGYLCYLGVKALRSGGESLPESDSVVGADAEPLRRYLARGFLSNALNPKVALFFLAFLPQFAGHASGARLQMVLLGATFAALTAVVFTALGYFSGTVGRWLQRRPEATKWLDRMTGCLFIALGARLALVQHGR